MPTAPPTLETERLILRPPVRDDLDAWLQFCADPEVMKTLGGVQPAGVAWRAFMTIAGSWSLNGFGLFSVIERATGQWVGRIGPWNPLGWPAKEVGWGLVRRVWGKGYATEGAKAAIDWAFRTLGWDEVGHLIETTNPKSIAVAERLGSRFLRDAMMPPPYSNPCKVYGQTRQEWLAR